MENIYLAVKVLKDSSKEENERSTDGQGLRHYCVGGSESEDKVIEVPIESLVVLFVLSYSENSFVKVNLVKRNQQTGTTYRLPHTFLKKLAFETHVVDLQNTPQQVQACTLPVLQDGQTCTAGLCSVLRWALKSQSQRTTDYLVHSLLGFRGGCLTACSEVSAWTKFCEVDMPASIQSTLLSQSGDRVELPSDLVRFENLLGRPVRTHNIEKRKLDIVKKQSPTPPVSLFSQLKIDNDSNKPASDNIILHHVYAEGIDKTLADLILFPCVHFLLAQLHFIELNLRKYLPLACDWYQRMLSEDRLARAAMLCGMQPVLFTDEINVKESIFHVEMPEVSAENLYTKHAKRPRTARKQDPATALEKLSSHNIVPEFSNFSSSMDEGLDWHNLPLTAHPAGGDLPLSRVDRKCQQVESMVLSVMELAVPNDVIVDFCSGGGHVGILLAYYLPKCKIIMIENKEASLQRARGRAEILQLDNVFFYQCNLDHFEGHFDIAVALHACGVATDLVIEKSLQHRAKFVCCPCCYGSVKQLANISYPRSKVFAQAGVSSEEFVHLSHCADRTEIDTACEAQGKHCMGLIDMDRSLYVKEHNYEVKLCTLRPPECTTKNNLIIGTPN